MTLPCIGPTCPKIVQGPVVYQTQTVTTSLTHWDISASSVGEQNLLGSLKDPTFSASLDKGSSLYDFGSARSIGSHVSGSFGLFLQAWQWCFLVALLCCCCGLIMCLVSGKRKKSSRTRDVVNGMDAGSEANEDEMGLLRESEPPPLIPLTSDAIRSSQPNAYSYAVAPMLTPSSSTGSYPLVAQQITSSSAGYPAGVPVRSYPGFAPGYPAQTYTYSAAPTSAAYA